MMTGVVQVLVQRPGDTVSVDIIPSQLDKTLQKKSNFAVPSGGGGGALDLFYILSSESSVY